MSMKILLLSYKIYLIFQRKEGKILNAKKTHKITVVSGKPPSLSLYTLK